MVTTVQTSDTLLGQTTPTGSQCPHVIKKATLFFRCMELMWIGDGLLCDRAALCDDVTTGSVDRLQPKDNRTPDSAVHCVICCCNFVCQQSGRILLGQVGIIIVMFLDCSRKQEAPRGSRDEKRRAQHNEGEIRVMVDDHPACLGHSFWFHCCSRAPAQRQNQQLDCAAVQGHPRLQHRLHQDGAGELRLQAYWPMPHWGRGSTKRKLWFQSKGGILSKACEYIKELRQSNLKLGDDINVLDRLRVDNQLLRQEVSWILLASGTFRQRVLSTWNGTVCHLLMVNDNIRTFQWFPHIIL